MGFFWFWHSNIASILSIKSTAKLYNFRYINIFFGQDLSKDQNLLIGLALSPENNGCNKILERSLNFFGQILLIWGNFKCQGPKVNIILAQACEHLSWNIKSTRDSPEISESRDFEMQESGIAVASFTVTALMIVAVMSIFGYTVWKEGRRQWVNS